jgi:hypothetical protein
MTTNPAIDRPGTGSAWSTVHARTAALREVIAVLDAGGALPWDARLVVLFGDRDALLVALHDTWSRRLGGRLDVALEVDDHRLEESVARAWLETAADLPGVRRVLDQHADLAALAAPHRNEMRTLAVAAGLATFADPIGHSVAVGARFVSSLRGRTADWLARRPPLWRRLLGSSAA